MFSKKPNLEKDSQPASSNIQLEKHDEFNDFFDEPLHDGSVAENQYVEQQYEQQTQIEYVNKQDNKKNKKNKKDKHKKNKNTVQEEVVEIKEKPKMILYIVIDRPVGGLINYFRERGVKVSAIFNNITDIKNTVLMQSEPTRVVVIDTGLGKFSATAMRKELIDMFGISDEQNRTTVFYTDSVIKMETTRELGKSSSKHIEWLPYKSTMVTAATLLSYDEEFIYDSEDKNDEVPTEEEIMNLKGLPIKDKYDSPRMDIRGISSESIITNLVDGQGEQLVGYKVRL